MGKDVELRKTHKVLSKSPRDVLQFNTLSQQLGLASQLKQLYQDATSVPYGFLLFDLAPKTVDSLRYCANGGSIQATFFGTSREETKFLDDEYTIRLFSLNISKIFLRLRKQFNPISPKDFIQILSRCLLTY